MRVLFVSPHLIESIASGGAQRSALLRNSLERIGLVDEICLPPKLTNKPSNLGSQVGSRRWLFPTDAIIGAHPLGSVTALHAFYSAGKHRWSPYALAIKELSGLNEYDFIVARYLTTAAQLDLFRHPRLLIDVDDYDPDRIRHRISSVNWLKRFTLKRCLRYSDEAHRNLLHRAAHCWVSNPADRRHPGLATATLLPNIPYFPAGLPQFLPPPPAKESPVFLIVGTLSYSANSDGIDAFLREAWLKLRNQVPNVELHIVGQGLSLGQRKRWGGVPGVKPIGFVESLSESYARCIATLAPILAGGGTNIKVLESSAYGRPCVVSRIAHRGFEETLPAGEACLRAEQIADMAEQCLRLIREPDLASRIGLRARACIELNYTPEVFNAAVMTGIRKVMDNGCLHHPYTESQ